MADETRAPPPAWLTTLLSNHVAVAALAATLGAGVMPVLTWIEAWRKDVKASELALVKEQEALWSRNIGCVGQASTWEHAGPRGLTVKISVCQASGDILVRYFANDWSPQYKWLRAPVPAGQPRR